MVFVVVIDIFKTKEKRNFNRSTMQKDGKKILENIFDFQEIHNEMYKASAYIGCIYFKQLALFEMAFLSF